MFWAIYPFLPSPFPFQTLSPFLRWFRDFSQKSELHDWFFFFSFFWHLLRKCANFLSKFLFPPFFFCMQRKKIKEVDPALYMVSLGMGSRGNCFCYNSFTHRGLCCKSSLCGQQPPWGFYSCALDAAEERRGKKTNICCGRVCSQCGLEPLNDSRGQFPERLRGTNTSSFTKDKPFWRGPRLPAR